MSTYAPGPDGPPQDPGRLVAEALADLAGLVRGGGRPGTTPDGLADDFARALQSMQGAEPLVIDVREDGLYLGGAEFWAHDLLARRVCNGLRDQGLRAVGVQPGASHKSLRGLALILTRDWSRQSRGALAQLLEGRQLPGVDLDFAEVSGSGALAALEPRAALEALRARMADEHPLLSPVLERLRHAMAQPDDLGEAVRGVGTDRGAGLHSELAAIAEGADVPATDIGRVVFETIRLDTSGLQAADSFRLVVDHYEQLVATGRPGDALELIRPALGLADPGLLPDWPHRDVFVGELGGLFHPDALVRLSDSAEQGGSREAWAALLLLLGRVCPADDRAAFCVAMGRLGSKDLRQAAADGLVLAEARPQEVLAPLLAKVEGRGLAVVLQGLSRVETPKLLEKILARIDHPEVVVREAALLALRKHRTPHTQERVRQALADPAETVRIEALRYLTVYRDPQAPGLVLQRLQTAPAGSITPAEARALGMACALIARQEAIEPLRQVAAEAAASRPNAALAAVIGLQSLGADGRAVLSALSRTSPELRRLIRDESGGQP